MRSEDKITIETVQSKKNFQFATVISKNILSPSDFWMLFFEPLPDVLGNNGS